MDIIRHARELKSGGRKVCVAIGTFDGVHLGHQQVIRQTISDARQHHAISLVITFDKHPAAIVAPDRVPPAIYSLSQKIRAIEQLGADAMLLIEFTREFSQTSGEVFVRRLVTDLGQVHSICVGNTFAFGHKRSGNVALLKTLGTELHFTVHGLAAVSLGNRIVSSTRIRETISAGNLDAASQMLGRPYSVAGTVIEGDHLGRQIGFPTANIETPDLLLPPRGVYAVNARLKNQYFAGAANIGVRPTVNQPKPALRFEVHLLDFNQQIYGEELEIVFAEKIRDERRFNSLDELKSQIRRDLDRARAILT